MTTSRRTVLKAAAGLTAAGMTWGRAGVAHAGRPDIQVDLSATTGKTLHKEIYGYASGALLDNDFSLAADPVVQRSAGQLSIPLLRFNTPVQTLIQRVFATGVDNPDWAPFDNWAKNRRYFLRGDGRLVFGIGPGAGDTSIPPATWAAYAAATAKHFRAINQEIMYWEVGNECNGMGAELYATYFNAIADALHEVNRDYLVGGPVASWWNGIDLQTFVEKSGSSGIGFIVFHSYPVNPTDSVQTAYDKAATFGDVAAARQAVAGTVAADVPIGLLEYNMNGAPNPDGSWGTPLQGTMTGAVYNSLLLTRCFTSDTNFTMGGMWDLVQDSNFGAIGNKQYGGDNATIDEQGRYLMQAAKLLPGRQVSATTTLSNVQVLATTNGNTFAIQLVNYDTGAGTTATVQVVPPHGKVLQRGTLARWQLTAENPRGNVTAIRELTDIALPAESIVIITGRHG